MSLARLAPRLALGAWVPVVLVLCAYLLGGHLLTMPRPLPLDPRLAAALTAGADGARWQTVHVLYEDCRCSARVIEHLVARGPRPMARERVLLVDASPANARRLREAGYELEVPTSAELERRYGVRAAPLLVVADPSGKVRYLGGYTARKQGGHPRDLEVLSGLMAGEDVPSLPMYGCAVSASLKSDLDPLGLR